jgi:hypothetical protein
MVKTMAKDTTACWDDWETPTYESTFEEGVQYVCPTLMVTKVGPGPQSIPQPAPFRFSRTKNGWWTTTYRHDPAAFQMTPVLLDMIFWSCPKKVTP